MTYPDLPSGRMRVRPDNPHQTVREDWLALAVEAPIDPLQPIIDAHHHLWNRPSYPYDDRTFLNEIAASGHAVKSTVFIECRTHYDDALPAAFRSLGETRWVASLHRPGPPEIAAAIVGFADLSIGARVDAVLERHMEAGRGRFRGVRNIVARSSDPDVRSTIYEAPDGFLAADDTRAGLSRLSRLGLSFETWLYHTQMDELRAVAEAFPDLIVIADHLGGPLGVSSFEGRRDEVFDAWRASMAAFARLPNTRVKFSGVGMAALGFGFSQSDRPAASGDIAASLEPWFDVLLECFGAGRIMFASNFPVDKPAFSYGVMWNAFKRLSANLSPDERNALFHDTAAATYRLPSFAA